MRYLFILLLFGCAGIIEIEPEIQPIIFEVKELPCDEMTNGVSIFLKTDGKVTLNIYADDSLITRIKGNENCANGWMRSNKFKHGVIASFSVYSDVMKLDSTSLQIECE